MGRVPGSCGRNTWELLKIPEAHLRPAIWIFEMWGHERTFLKFPDWTDVQRLGPSVTVDGTQDHGEEFGPSGQ